MLFCNRLSLSYLSFKVLHLFYPPLPTQSYLYLPAVLLSCITEPTRIYLPVFTCCFTYLYYRANTDLLTCIYLLFYLPILQSQHGFTYLYLPAVLLTYITEPTRIYLPVFTCCITEPTRIYLVPVFTFLFY